MQQPEEGGGQIRIIIVSVAVALLTFLAFSWPGVAAAPAQLADGAEQSNLSLPVDTGRLLVKFKAGAGTQARSLALSQAGAEPAGKVRGLGISIVQVPAGRTPEALRTLRADPRVEFAEPDYVVRAAAETIPWGVTRVGAPTVWPSYTGTGVVVAVVDTGVQLNHPDLDPNIDSNGRDFVNNDFNASDDNGHGTAVAGVVAAVDNEIGVIGVAPAAKILPVKVLDEYGEGSHSLTASGITWAADQGAEVINLSLGGLGSSTTLQLAVDYAEDQGAIVIAASGNSGWYVPEYPAAYPDVVSVGALDSSNDIADFSDWGSSWGKVDIAAPGVDIESTYFESGYLTASGTSLAAPHVAGVAALLASQYTGASPARLRQLLLGTATDVGTLTPDVTHNDLETGAGLVDAVSASSGTDPLLSLRGDATLATELGPFGPRGLRRLRSGVTDTLDVLAGVSSSDGSAIVGDGLTFTATGGDISPTSDTTDPDGVGRTTASSTQKGRMQVSVDPTVPDLHDGVFEIRVAGKDDEIPGRSPPSNVKILGSLDDRTDVADVWAISLKGGQTLEASLSGAGGTAFFLCLYARDSVSLFESLPETCSIGSGYPQSIKFKVPSGQGGTWYLSAFSLLGGGGTYTLPWKVKIPGVISPLAVTNPRFSPNGDGVKDTAKITFKTYRGGSLRLDIFNSSGKKVKFQTKGVKGPGKYSFKWNGRKQSGTLAPNGKYTARVKWRSAPGYFQRQATLHLDTIPPSFASLSDNPDPFYPRRDGYKDYSHIKYKLREKAKLDLRISPKGSTRTIKRIVTGLRPKGQQEEIKWNGRKGDGTLVGAGVYEYRFKLTDRAGNKKWTKRYPVTVSLKRIVKKSVTMTKDAVNTLGGEGRYWYSGCGYAVDSPIYYRGARLSAPDCNWGKLNDWVRLEYRFTAPGAVRYYSITVSQYGRSLTNNHLYGGVLNRKTGMYDFEKWAGPAEKWHTYPTVSASGRVSGDRRIKVAFALTDEEFDSNRYDIRDVRIKIVYGVLR